MPTPYLVRYSVLPPGAGPDDYEPADLVQREETFELSDPDPVESLGGQPLSYGPTDAEVEEAVRPRLAEGERAIILSVRVA